MKSSTDIHHLNRWRMRGMVILFAFVAFFPTWRLGFLWDDHVMIEANPALREWSAKALKHDFTTDVFDGHGDPYYRPAQTLLNRVDYTLWGLHPFGYHLTNWTGHALNALLIVELTLALGFGDLVALLVGCLFAVHPIPIEQLMIIAGRAEIFGFTFMLASLLLLLREEPWAWVLGYGAFVIALLFKESTLITPLLLACLYLYRREKPRAYGRILPLFILIPPYLLARHHAVGPLLVRMDPVYAAQFFLVAFSKVLWIYVRLILVPWNLHSHRMMPHMSHEWFLFLLGWMALAIFLVQTKSRVGLLSLAWFILMLLPKTPIMIYGNFMLDHWAYPASFGILLPLSVGYAHLWQSRRVVYKYWLGMTFFPLLIAWALLAHLNVALRGTDEKMYRWALHFTESHPIKYNLGVLLLQTGRAREAIDYFQDQPPTIPKTPTTCMPWPSLTSKRAIRGRRQYIYRVIEREHPTVGARPSGRRTTRKTFPLNTTSPTEIKVLTSILCSIRILSIGFI